MIDDDTEVTALAPLAPRVVEAELVDEAPAGFVRVRVLRHPFTLEREDFTVPEGVTLAQIVEQAAIAARWTATIVTIDGGAVPREWWPRVRPRRGHFVLVRALPAGGGGGGDKGWFQILLGTVLAIVGFFVPLIGPALTSLGVGMALNGVPSLLLPPGPGPTHPELPA
jgi:hypothetical protein